MILLDYMYLDLSCNSWQILVNRLGFVYLNMGLKIYTCGSYAFRV